MTKKYQTQYHLLTREYIQRSWIFLGSSSYPTAQAEQKNIYLSKI